MLNDIKKLEIGKQQEIRILIKSAENAKTRTGDSYQRLTVRDENDHETIILNFRDRIEGNFPLVVNATVDTSEYRESASIRILSYQIDNKAGADQFLPKAAIDRKKTLTALSQKSQGIRMGLRKIVAEVLNEHVAAFSTYPFSNCGLFARGSGILEASYKLTLLAEQTAEILHLDRDLMIAGAMLYYIGRTQTIDRAYNYTPDDVLLGNGMAAAMIVQAKVQEIRAGKDEELKKALDDTDIRLLEHILASRAKGIPTAIPEACALRHLDAIVTETEAIASVAEDSGHDTIVQDRNLFGNRVYVR